MDTKWLVLWWLQVMLLGASSALRKRNEMFDYVGCYEDTQKRALTTYKGPVNSIDECINRCRQMKAPYAGLQFGYECYCGTNYNKYGESVRCTLTCPSGEICGGYWANSVYRVDPLGCACSVSGDPHYNTFDGQMIHFMGTCKYTLAMTTVGAPEYFAVEVKNEHRGNNRVSYTRMVDIKLELITIRLLPGNKMLVNGHRTTPPLHDYIGISAIYSGGWMTVSTKWGLQVQFDGRHRANVRVPKAFANKLTGICGDCNGKKDDLRTKNGTDVSKDRNRFSEVGNSHRVKDDSDKPESSCDVTDVDTNCTPAQTQRCQVIYDQIFQKCRQKLGDERVKEYLNSCKIDACIYHDDIQVNDKVVCEAIEGFSRECEEAGVTLDWRGVSKCGMTCPLNHVYQFNALVCQPSCTEPQPKCEEREEACVCKDGYILSGEDCVPKSECGCINNKIYMKVNEEIIDWTCKAKTVCKPGGKLITEISTPCPPNSECRTRNGDNRCWCKEGFELRKGNCLPVHPCQKNPCKNEGKCIKDGGDFTCECKEPFYGKECSKKKPDCRCSVSGDPHYRTFDGEMIHFMGICKYTLATSTKEAPYFFAVEVKNEHRGNKRVSYTRMVDIKLPNVTIRLLPGHKMLVNGERQSLPINYVLGFSAKFAGGWITVFTEWGLQVQFDGRHRANVKVPATFANKLSGICGDCNGKKDDLRTKDGQDVSKDRDRFSKVGNSHKVKDDSDKPEVSCNVTDVDTKCTPAQTQRCDVIQHEIFKKCRQKLGVEHVKEYLDSCKIDACIYHEDSNVLEKVVCEAIEGFARECEEAGFTLDWRGVSKCAMACPPNQVYQFNALVCQPSCTEPQPKCEERAEACVCKDGYVLSGEDCVSKSQCGCFNNGTYMKVNQEKIDSKCTRKFKCKPGGTLDVEVLALCQPNSECKIENEQHTCACKEGFYRKNGKCQKKPDCHCSVSGDPHYRTFDGEMIHFMGTCKYTLSTSSEQSAHYFAVEVKNEHRRNKRVSYTRMVDIKLPHVTIRLLPGHKMLINGERKSLPINNVLGFSAKFAGGWITVFTEWGLQVQFDGRHRANVKVPATFANKLSGICGDCNGKKDDLRTKDGQDVSKDRNRFSKVGNSHKVKDDSDKPELRCDVTDVNTTCKPTDTHRCDVIQHIIFKECREELDDERVTEYLKSCKIDACIYHNDTTVVDKVVCEAIEGFTRECEEAGFTLDWRGVSKCVMTCPPNQQYQFNALECQPSCTEPQQKCEKREESCVCKDGYILSGEDCVPKSQCGCISNGGYMKVNEEVVDSNCQTKTICQSGGKLVSEKLTLCQDNSECSIANGQRTCVCKEGFYRHNKKCFPQECEKTMADVVFLLDDSQHMIESNSAKVKEFMKDIVSSFNIGDDHVRVGSVSFSDWVENNFHLNHNFNISGLLNAIDAIKRYKRTYFITKALDYLRTKSFTAANGDRVNAPNIAIIITDGKPKIETETLEAVKSIKNSGVIIFAIAVGNSVQTSDLAVLGSEPSPEFVFAVDNFGTLDSIKNHVNKRICSVHVCDYKPCKHGGKCVPQGNEYTCLCTDPFQGKDCSQMKPDCSCSVSGDPHYKSFDGQMIHFMGICKYTLASSTKGAPEFFTVEVKNEHRGNTRVSYTRMVDVKLKGVTIRLLPGNTMLVNGEKRSLPISNVLGFSAKFAGSWITVSTQWGLQVQFDGRHRANVKIPATFINKLSGICGDCNGKKDDLRTKDGQDVSKDRDRFSKVGNSHKVKDDSDKPEHRCDDVTDVNTKCTPAETERCETINHKIFQTCGKELGDEHVKKYLDSCKIDACFYQNDSKVLGKVVCEAIEGFARECEQVGFPLDWRGVSKCDITCPPNQVYTFNALACQPSCTEPRPKCQEREEACVCKDGYILSGKECVPKAQCGCINDGIYMKVNEEITDSNCQTKTICKSGGKLVSEKITPCQVNSKCSVENGRRSCVCKEGFQLQSGTCKKKPDCHCSVSGDPHYRTFDGGMIHFMGICKYTLATSRKEAPYLFAVEVKNEHRGNTRVSYTRMVDIKLPNVIIRLLPGHTILVNHEKRSLPINNVLGFSAKFAGGWITVFTEWGLQVQFDGRHRANVKVPATFANKLSGICGDCNGKKDDLRTKDGQDVSKDRDRFSKVGNSHKVKDDSDKPELRCDVTDVDTKCTPAQTQRCDVIQHKTFQTCRQKLGDERVKEYVDSCKIDACIYHNDSNVLANVVCEAIEGFARECETSGIPLDWRGVSKCGITCSPNQVYQFNALVCQPSCTEPQPKCQEREEACVCKDGYILSGEMCVSKSECGCVHNGIYMKVNEEIIDSKCQTKTTCKYGGKLVGEKVAPCQANSECTVGNGRRHCVCKEGFQLRDGKCKMKVCFSNPCKNGGKCTENDEAFSCKCKEPFYGKQCFKRKPDCHCSVSGDPHYRTFDGEMIHFMGICKYTLATSTKEAPYFFAVEVKNEHRGNKRVSYTRMVDIKLPNVTIRLLPGHKMLVNGERRSLPINNVLGFSAKFAGGWITVFTEWGLRVQFDGRHRANVKVPATFANKLSGICGDCNGKKDDLRTKDGQDVSKDRDRFSKVGNSHTVKDDSDKPETRCDVTDVNTNCTPSQTKKCDVIQHEKFKICRQKLGVEHVKEYLDSCKIDACIYHEDSNVLEKVVCDAIEGFTRECEKAGFPLDWRGMSKCGITCPPNQVYQFNALVCQPSCTEPQPKCQEREEACVCKDGYILSGEMCVSKSECGCVHNGIYMKVNEEITDSNCQTKTMCKSGGKLVSEKITPCQVNSKCSVENGRRSCVCKEGFQLQSGTCKEKPPCTCSASGDPHYRTFDGEMIHFMGICKYTLATSTKEAPYFFAVEVKNEHRGNTRVSYTRMVDVKLPNVTIRLLPGHKMLVNGEKRSLPINKFLGFSAKFSGGWITISTEWGLQVQFDGRHRANVKVPATFANKLSGICGDCNGKKDDLRTKDGQDVSKDRDRFSKVGNSHTVKDDSDKPESRCDVTDVDTKCTPAQTQRCNIIQHETFTKCEQKLGDERVKEYLDSCKIDACIYHNDTNILEKVVCEAIEGFARECEQFGFLLNWRGVSKCAMTCQQNQKYTFNALACQPSCSEPQPKCKEKEESCVCKQGYILSGEDCVPKSQCGCLNNSIYMKVNEEILDSNCRTKIICTPGGKLETQKLSPCQIYSTCKIENGERTCVCDEGFMLRDGKCTPTVDPCEAHPCQNGGKCITEGLTRTCECIGPFDGNDCSKIASDCVCSGSGDPHYKTFDGQWIHFMGTCKYTLATLHNTSRLTHFAVEVKNEHRGNTRVSYTRLVDLKLYGVTIRLLQGNKMMVNGELITLPLIDYLGFSAHFSAGWITVSTDYGIHVEFDGRHRVNVRVPNVYRHGLTGICGDCNGKKDDFKTKAGVDVAEKENKFSLIGESYRVLDDSDAQEKNCISVDGVETCGPPETTACNIVRPPKGPFAVCLIKLGSDASGYYNSCVIDSCAYKDKPKLRDIVRCQAFETLARKCEEIGISVNWRDATKCPMGCPLDKLYSYRTSACQPSCSTPYPACDRPFIEGCVCKSGTILSGTECVPRLSCGCNYRGRYMKAGSSILLSDCSKRITCISSGNISVELGCRENAMCAIQGGTRRCVCQTGFQLFNGICRKVVALQPPIVDPEFLGPVMHMFFRISVAYLKGNPLVYMERYSVTNTMSVDAKSCAKKCLKTKTCKSFNYNQLQQTCVLLSINAETQTLVSSDCPYQDYYQLIDSMTITVKGATMLSCNHLESIQKVGSWKECQTLCADGKCKAMEYSSFQKTCTTTNDTRKSHGLTGDELWDYQEKLDEVPKMPENI